MKKIGEIKKAGHNNYRDLSTEQLKEKIAGNINNAHLLFAMTRNIEIVQHCIDTGMVLPDSTDMTSFISYAISASDIQLLREFEKRNMMPTEETYDNILALFNGYIQQSDELIMYLLEHNVEPSNFTPERLKKIVTNNKEWVSTLPAHIQIILSC